MNLLVFSVQSCSITVDSIVNEKNSFGNNSNNTSNDTGTQFDWPWTITIDSINGNDSEGCLSQTVPCKTLGFVLNGIANVSTRQAACLKLILSNNSKSHILYNAPSLSAISLYFVSEEDAVITCKESMVNTATAWSIQNADFVVFDSLHFSNCSQRLKIANITNVYIKDVKIR